MVNFRILSENEFRTGKSDYAKSLRAQFGEDGYEKYSAQINSIIEDAKEKNKDIAAENPLKKSNEARIAYLEAEYARAIADTNKKKGLFHNLIKNLSAMLKISLVQEEDLALKEQAYHTADSNQDAILDALHEAYLARGFHGYNA